MKKENITISENALSRFQDFVVETDIRILVYVPPFIGFIFAFAILFIANRITNGHLSQSFKDFILGIAFLTPLFSGFAEIYKKEMPASFGRTIKGNLAVVSGVIIVVVFGFSSLMFFYMAFLNH